MLLNCIASPKMLNQRGMVRVRESLYGEATPESACLKIGRILLLDYEANTSNSRRDMATSFIYKLQSGKSTKIKLSMRSEQIGEEFLLLVLGLSSQVYYL